MKVSITLQNLTKGMASGGQEEWSEHMQMGEAAPRTDLDLGACLDVESLDELSQTLYGDGDTSQSQNAWVENVIDVTSTTDELTASSGDHMSVVPDSEDVLESFNFGQPTLPTGGSGSLAASDNATFFTLQNFGATTESGTVDFSQLGDLRTAALATTTTTSTVDLTPLQQFLMLNSDATSLQDLDGSAGGNIPNNIWNLDLALATTAPMSDASAPVVENPDVKESLRSRLHSRYSVASTSQDSDALGCRSTRSLSSSSSSLTQSFEEEDLDDPVKALEKREKNRLAAQKCRNKKRDKTDSLQKDVSRLEDRQERLKQEVQKLRDERENLEEIINVHGMVCPKMRKISKS